MQPNKVTEPAANTHWFGATLFFARVKLGRS